MKLAAAAALDQMSSVEEYMALLVPGTNLMPFPEKNHGESAKDVDAAFLQQLEESHVVIACSVVW